MTGRTFEVSVDRTTVGRMEDNTFQIADPSVSSHHAEILLQGSDLLIRDIGSTNGTFINGDKITEAVLKPGQTLRFGQVELKIDDGKPVPPESAPAPVGAAPASAPAPAPTPAKKSAEATVIMSRGVSLTDLGQSGVRPAGFDNSAAFSKKSNKSNKYILIGGIVIFVVILVLILFLIKQAGASK